MSGIVAPARRAGLLIGIVLAIAMVGSGLLLADALAGRADDRTEQRP